MAANFSNTYMLNVGVQELCALLRDARFINPLKLNYKGEAPIQNGAAFSFYSNINMASWGENIDIYIMYMNENTSQVTIRSECSMPTQLIDWGKNKQNVEKIYAHLYALITYNQNVTAPQPQAAPQPQTVVRNAFCSNCGTKLNPDANFCNNCGTKVN